jgi:hypothetical protein
MKRKKIRNTNGAGPVIIRILGQNEFVICKNGEARYVNLTVTG